MTSTALADSVLISHIIYVGIVVLAVPLIIIGKFMRWGWVRNMWLRSIHLGMIAIVVVETVLGIKCPLTIWERSLRTTSDQANYQSPDFIADIFDRLLFWHLPHWAFGVMYALFGALIISLFFIVPIERSK